MSGPRVLLVDNYDSFVGMLYQLVGELGGDPRLVRNDAIEPEAVAGDGTTHVVISPGPGRPEAAGASIPLVRALLGRLPILGVCLGHQAIAAALGGRVRRARRVVHGKATAIRHDGTGVLRGLPSPFTAGRYHSLVVDGALPPGLVATAWSEGGEVMALRHETAAVHGVQFHPESVLSEAGRVVMANFLAEGP